MITKAKVDPRVRRTRKLLQEAFVELLAERGLRATTVQDIAERAAVNRATFYAHFTDKYALADSYIREQFQDVLSQALPADAPVTRANLHALCRAVCEHLVWIRDVRCRPDDHEQFELMVKTAVPEELHAFISGWLTRLPRASSPPEISSTMAATVMSWAIFGAAIHWSRDPRRDSADAFAWQVVAALLDGMPHALGISGRYW